MLQEKQKEFEAVRAMKQAECDAKSQKKAEKRKRKRERQRQKAKSGDGKAAAHDDDDGDSDDNDEEEEHGSGKKKALSGGSLDVYRAPVQLKNDGHFLERMKAMFGENGEGGALSCPSGSSAK